MCHRNVYFVFLTMFTLAACTSTTPQATATRTLIPPALEPKATTVADMGPSLVALSVNGVELEAVDGVFSIPGEVKPGDKLQIEVQISDDEQSGGEVKMLNVVRTYVPDENGSAEIKFAAVIPADLQAAKLSLSIIPQSGKTLEYILEFIPGDGWAPIVTIENPTGFTGEVSLIVSVMDMNGAETIAGFSVVQEFNFQIPEHADEIIANAGLEPISIEEQPAGLTKVVFADESYDFLFKADKEIQEYISTNNLAPIQVKQLEPGLYAVNFSTEWPGRFPLHLTAVDADGNESTERVPVEVYWAEMPWQWRGMVIEMIGSGDLSMVPSLIDHAQQNNMNFIVFSSNWVLADNSNDIGRCEDNNDYCFTPTDEQIGEWIDHAHDRGLSVMLAPHLLCFDACTSSIDIEHPNWNEWFSNYSALIVNQAKIAEGHNAEALSIGDELWSTHFYPTQWHNLLSEVKEVYNGEITYMDFTYWTAGEGFPLENELSFLGVNAFYPGTDEGNRDPTVDEMESYIQVQMLRLLIPRMEASGRTAVATSLGRTPHDSTAYDPWETLSNPLDRQEQIDYFEASFRNVSRYFAGIAVWAYEVSPENELFDRAMDPRASNLTDLLRIWFYSPDPDN